MLRFVCPTSSTVLVGMQEEGGRRGKAGRDFRTRECECDAREEDLSNQIDFELGELYFCSRDD